MAPMFASLTMNVVFDIQLRLTDLVLISGQYFFGVEHRLTLQRCVQTRGRRDLETGVRSLTSIFTRLGNDGGTSRSVHRYRFGVNYSGPGTWRPGRDRADRDGPEREPGRGHDTPRPPFANDYHDWPHSFRAYHKIETKEAFQWLTIDSKKGMGPIYIRTLPLQGDPTKEPTRDNQEFRVVGYRPV